uniref:Uncharacterized protein n=1 Tax=Arundo donax TaxID=35708 RepID=A0A0A9C3M8_ARUDO
MFPFQPKVGIVSFVKYKVGFMCHNTVASRNV